MHRMLYIFAVKITFKHKASLLHNCMQVIACENFYFCRLLQFLARRFQALPYINYMSVKKCLKVDYLPTPYSYLVNMFIFTVPSVLWSCWLGGRKGIRPVKNWLVWCWRGYLVWLSVCSEVQIAYVPADATATHCLASLKSRLVLPFWYWLTRVVPVKGPLNGCMYEYIYYVKCALTRVILLVYSEMYSDLFLAVIICVYTSDWIRSHNALQNGWWN